ncbi:MAG: cytochrome P450 [Chloroflexota bacterium]|nr:cytochrome P450 [Chloroflexota bacterium]
MTGHAEVMAILRDTRVSARRFMLDTAWIPEEQRAVLGPPIEALSRLLLFVDPPSHTRLRKLISKAFTPRIVEGMRAHIQQHVDDLLDAVEERGCFDIIRDLAYPLPAIVIAEMLGVSLGDRGQFTRWTRDFNVLLNGMDGKGRSLTPHTAMQMLQSVIQLMDYFRAIIARRADAPKDDLLQVLLEAEEQGDVLSETELLGNCLFLLAAGHMTTTNLLGNGTLTLLKHPDQLQLLKEDPSLVATAIMELLRYESPIQSTGRVAKENIDVRGQHINAGQEFMLSLGAANRDPAQFPDPDRLDIRRSENRHLAFAYGIHFCVGAPLANIEAQIFFNTLFHRFPDLRLEGEEPPHWQGGLIFRGLKRLPARWRKD